MSTIEVVYSLPGQQFVVQVEVPDGALVQDAIERSGLLTEHPEMDLAGLNKVGIWNKLAKLDSVVRDGDRVEIYRPLIADPKEVRRQRAEEGKVMKKGG
jgi:putative ubiquitin-RnfH superfamily antitoxin RatB of RatAB toxin-antitoxin module